MCPCAHCQCISDVDWLLSPLKHQQVFCWPLGIRTWEICTLTCKKPISMPMGMDIGFPGIPMTLPDFSVTTRHIWIPFNTFIFIIFCFLGLVCQELVTEVLLLHHFGL